ncbi:MAG: hypothetical protein ACUVRU_10830 [Anaerolineae bacterium]
MAQPESKLRRSAGLIGTAAVTVLALGLPLIFGLTFYLFLSEEIVVNAGDPIREARLWTIRERQSVTGLAWSIAMPERPANDDSGEAVQCARMRVRYLKWDGGLRFEPDSDYCQCYQRRDSGWTSTSVGCRVE